jgi:hypothetical protein
MEAPIASNDGSSVQSDHRLPNPPPTQEHIDWTRRQLSLVKIGGVWIIPRSMTIVTRETGDSVSILGPESAPGSALVAHIEAAGFKILSAGA